MQATIASLPYDLREWYNWRYSRETYEYPATTRSGFTSAEAMPFRTGGAEFSGEVPAENNHAKLNEVFFLHGIVWKIIVVDTRKSGMLRIVAKSVASLQDLIELIPIT
jgi:hypothetical protein